MGPTWRRCSFGRAMRVFGGCRRASSPNRWRLKELDILDHEHLHLIDHDLTDLGSSIRALEHAEPAEVYNLGAQSFVAVSFDQPDLTAMVSAIGALKMLEAIRICNSGIRYYQASSAEMYGKVQCTPQNEATPFYPRSPYGVAKTYRSLDYEELSRVLRTFRLLRDAVQPRVAAARVGVCDQENQPRGRPHSARPS